MPAHRTQAEQDILDELPEKVSGWPRNHLSATFNDLNARFALFGPALPRLCSCSLSASGVTASWRSNSNTYVQHGPLQHRLFVPSRDLARVAGELGHGQAAASREQSGGREAAARALREEVQSRQGALRARLRLASGPSLIAVPACSYLRPSFRVAWRSRKPSTLCCSRRTPRCRPRQVFCDCAAG